MAQLGSHLQQQGPHESQEEVGRSSTSLVPDSQESTQIFASEKWVNNSKDDAFDEWSLIFYFCLGNIYSLIVSFCVFWSYSFPLPNFFKL